MKFLYNSASHFNLANLITFTNITAGLMATYFITQNNFVLAIILAWLGGAADIFDGKIARKYNLSNEFGVQLLYLCNLNLSLRKWNSYFFFF